MAERVFPNNINVDMGSPIQFSGINWGEVADSMKNNRFADDKSQAVIDLLQAAGFELDPDQEEEITGIVDQLVGQEGDTMDDELHDEGKPFGEEESHNEMHEESMPEGLHEEDEADGPDAHEFSLHSGRGGLVGGDASHEVPWKMSGADNKMKKIAFTHPCQISAEAIEAAQSKGDQRLVNTILAARKENRIRIASAIKKQAEARDNKNTKTASKKDANDLFVSPEKFSTAQRESFKKIAVSLGMPKDYVDAMCGNQIISTSVDKLNNQVKEVYASNMSTETKTNLIAGLVKEAKLDQDSKSEFINYWNNILGYQDKDFWPQVAADYEDGKKVK